jgi:hypothetical protein
MPEVSGNGKGGTRVWSLEELVGLLEQNVAGGCGMIQRHKWSVLSLSITIGMWAVLGGYAEYQFHTYHLATVRLVPILGGFSVFASVTTGGIAAKKEHASLISLTAILLGALSIASYTV